MNIPKRLIRRAKCLNIPSQGGEINHAGARTVKFTPEGDANGSHRAVTVTEDGFETVRIR